MDKFSVNPVELRRLRQQACEIEHRNQIIKVRFDDSGWKVIEEHVSNCEKQIELLKKSLLQAEALWNELSRVSAILLEKISGHMKQLEAQEVSQSTSDECSAQEIADALFYVHVQSDKLTCTSPPSDGSCAGGICYLLGNVQAQIWWKLCAVTIFQYDSVFDRFYKMLGNSADCLDTFVRKNQSMLFHNLSLLFIKRLYEKLSWNQLHSLLIELKDENMRTFIYHESNPELLVEFYTAARQSDLYQLLSERDKNGQTALHVNPSGLSKLLIYSFSPSGPKTTELFFQLLHIKDNNNKTAIDCAGEIDKERILWLENQAKAGCYALYNPAVVLLYNMKNRAEAGTEAHGLFNALETIGLRQYRHENFDERSLIEAIDDAAKRTRTALIVVLMAHGSKGVIYDVMNEPIILHKIHHQMCSYEHLKEKPKILITQCCQQIATHEQPTGHKMDSRPPNWKALYEDRPPFIPKEDHFCAYMSCVEGQPAPRNVFIPSLAEKIRESGKTESLERVFKRVKIQLAEEGHFNIPVVHSTLHGELCLKQIF